MIIDDITMEGIRGIRQIVNATVLDVLYYMSPVYCQDIVNSVCRSLNRQYGRFRKRNPDFDGQVGICVFTLLTRSVFYPRFGPSRFSGLGTTRTALPADCPSSAPVRRSCFRHVQDS
jgi:hypothetical protein